MAIYITCKECGHLFDIGIKNDYWVKCPNPECGADISIEQHEAGMNFVYTDNIKLCPKCKWIWTKVDNFLVFNQYYYTEYEEEICPQCKDFDCSECIKPTMEKTAYQQEVGYNPCRYCGPNHNHYLTQEEESIKK